MLSNAFRVGPGLGGLAARLSIGTTLAKPPTLPPPELLDSFNTLAGRTTGGTTPTISMVAGGGIHGGDALRLESAGKDTFQVMTTKAIGNVVADDLGVIVVAVKPENPLGRGFGSVTPRLILAGTTYNLGQFYFNGNGETEGWRYEARHVSEIPNIAGKSGALSLQMSISPKSNNGARHASMLFGAAYIKAKGPATVLWTVDDTRNSMDTYLQPLLDARSLKATSYWDWRNVGLSDHQKLAQMQRWLAAGHAVCLNGTGDDRRIMASPPGFTGTWNTDAWIAELNEGRAALAALGAPADWGNHITYPYNQMDGLADGNANPAPVYGIMSGEIVGNTITLTSRSAAPAIGAVVYCAGLRRRVTVTGVPDATHVTLSEPITVASGVAIAFADESPAFYPGKAVAALKAAGFKSATRGVRGNGVNDNLNYTRFGVPMPFDAVFRQSLTNMPWAGTGGLQEIYERNKLRGSTLITTMHSTGPGKSGIDQPDTLCEPYADACAADVQAGNVVVMTVPKWWERDGAASYPIWRVRAQKPHRNPPFRTETDAQNGSV